MAAYNAANHIEDSIRSIQNQTYKNWELVIIDDCSTDNTPQIIKNYSSLDTRIKYLRNKVNTGPYLSANRGLDYSKGDFIARLDSDDISEPSRLDLQVNYLDCHQDISLVGTGGYLIDEQGNRTSNLNVVSRQSLIKKIIKKVNPFIHSSILVRRDTILEIGGYRDRFRYAADYDLLLRLSDHYNLSNLPKHLVGWRIPNRNSITSKHHVSQRIYADIARQFAYERQDKGYDSYSQLGINTIYEIIAQRYRGRYLCESGIYKIIFGKKYKEGLSEFFKGITKGGIPYNSMVRTGIQAISPLLNINHKNLQ